MRRDGFVRKGRRFAVAGCVAVAVGVPGVASAQTLYTGTPAPNAGSVDVGSTGGGGSTGVFRAESTGSTSLALTGADLAELGIIGLGAIGTGVVLVRRARRTT
jgi:hypothetical protein